MNKETLLKCLPSSRIRAMQIKASLKFHLILIRMARIKKAEDNTCQLGCGGAEDLCALLVGMEAGANSVYVCVCGSLGNKRIDQTRMTQLYHFWIYTQKSLYPATEMYTSAFNSALLSVVGTCQQPRRPSASEQIMKTWHLCAMELTSHKGK